MEKQLQKNNYFSLSLSTTNDDLPDMRKQLQEIDNFFSDFVQNSEKQNSEKQNSEKQNNRNGLSIYRTNKPLYVKLPTIKDERPPNTLKIGLNEIEKFGINETNINSLIGKKLMMVFKPKLKHKDCKLSMEMDIVQFRVDED